MTFISIAVASIPSFAQWGIPQAVTKLKQVCANSVAGQVSCWYVAGEAYDAAKPYVHSAGRAIVNGASNAANLAVPGNPMRDPVYGQGRTDPVYPNQSYTHPREDFLRPQQRGICFNGRQYYYCQ